MIKLTFTGEKVGIDTELCVPVKALFVKDGRYEIGGKIVGMRQKEWKYLFMSDGHNGCLYNFPDHAGHFGTGTERRYTYAPLVREALRGSYGLIIVGSPCPMEV